MASNLDHAKNWKTTTKRYVAYIDIMGFKDIVARNRHQKVYGMMKSIIDSMTATQKAFGKTSKNSNNLLMMTYSDSIIIYSENDSVESQKNTIDGTANLIDFLIEDEIPFRGAMAFGNMTLDIENSIFFGQPLIDAYLLSEELAFYGIAVHATAEYRKGFSDNSSVCVYPCLFKNGVANHLTIAPIQFVINDTAQGALELLQKHVLKLGANSSGSIRKYIDNTLKYLDFLKHYYDQKS
jgi:hypothetical protein